LLVSEPLLRAAVEPGASPGHQVMGIAQCFGPRALADRAAKAPSRTGCPVIHLQLVPEGADTQDLAEAARCSGIWPRELQVPAHASRRAEIANHDMTKTPNEAKHHEQEQHPETGTTPGPRSPAGPQVL